MYNKKHIYYYVYPKNTPKHTLFKKICLPLQKRKRQKKQPKNRLLEKCQQVGTPHFNMGVNPKMVGKTPTNPWGLTPTKNDHFGV